MSAKTSWSPLTFCLITFHVLEQNFNKLTADRNSK